MATESNEKKVTITEDEYNLLLESDLFLKALHNYGVVYWEGYKDAEKIYENSKKEEK